jgi:CubicO group peptidase (beta-lactamase class C family)
MKKILVILPFLFIGHLLPGQPQAFKPVDPQEGGFSSERLLRLDAYLHDITSNGTAPNALAFVAHHGEIVYYKTFGYRNIEKNIPLQKDDIFRIASQTKAITTAALMILYEEGKFLMDDPLYKYIPAFKNPQVLVDFDAETKKYTTRPAKSHITVRQLLSHTSGISYQHPLEVLPEFNIPYYNSMDSITIADVVAQLARRPLVCDPGTQFVYGMSTDVAGYLIEILSGMNLADFIRQRITEPLGMNDSYFYLPASKQDRLVELYTLEKTTDTLAVHPNESFRKYPLAGAKTLYLGGAGMVGTAMDYAKFIQMILNGGSFNGKRILSRKTVELMTANQIGDLEVWDRKDRFGLGFQIITPSSRYGDLASPGALTWGGMYCSEYTIDPREDLILLVFTNVHPYAYYGDFVHRFRTLVYQALN